MDASCEDDAKRLISTSYASLSDRASPRLSIYERLWDSWYPEIVALCFSVACAVAIAATLIAYNGHPTPRMKYDVTLNAVVSVLATACKVALIFAVSNCIGQLKWTWLSDKKTKSLMDATIFDNASRGPYGALQMLTGPTRQSLASIGAIVVVLALTFDPFTQQVLTYESSIQYTESENAIIAAAQSYAGLVTGVPFKMAVGSVLYTDDYTWTPKCPSGNCTWQGFETLAWHSRCFMDPTWTMEPPCTFQFVSDQTKDDKVEEAEGVSFCRAQAAQGMPVDVTTRWWYDYNPSDPSSLFYGPANLPIYQVSPTWAAVSAYPDVYKGMSQPEGPSQGALECPIYAFGALNITYSNQTGNLEVSGETCEIDLYVDVYDLEVLNGVLGAELRTSHGLRKVVTQLILASSEQKSAAQMYICFERNATQPLNFTALNELQQLDWSTGYDAARTHKPFDWCNTLTTFSDDLLNLTLSANVSSWWSTRASGSLDLTAEDMVLTDWDPGDLVTSGIAGDVFSEAGHEHVMKRLSASLTAMTLDPKKNINATKSVTGQVGNMVNLVRVRWRWLILPYALCLTGIILLAATISIQRQTQAPLWKCSVNAFFYHGLDFDMGIESRLNTVAEMDAQATVTRVKLKPFGIQQRLMLETTVLKRHVVDD